VCAARPQPLQSPLRQHRAPIDGARGRPIAIGVFHAAQPGSEFRIERGFDCIANGVCFRGNIDYVSRALAALLAHAHVNDRQRQRSRLHDAARRISNDDVDLTKQAAISGGIEVDEDVGVGSLLGARSCALDQRLAAGVGVGINEDKLTSHQFHRRKE
jgi:hypothetical protein